MKRASPPRWRTNSALASPAVVSRSTTTTLAPRPAKPIALARPMPPPPPVIKATLPANSICVPPSVRVHQQNSLAGNAAIAQLLGHRGEVAPASFQTDLRLQRSVGDQRHEQREVRREPVFGFGVEIAEALYTRVRRAPEVSERKRR